MFSRTKQVRLQAHHVLRCEGCISRQTYLKVHDGQPRPPTDHGHQRPHLPKSNR